MREKENCTTDFSVSVADKTNNANQQQSSNESMFGPPKLNKDGKPVCYGNFIFGRKCDCEFAWSCQFYTYDNKAQRSRESHFTHHETVPIIDGMDWECPPECAGTDFDTPSSKEDREWLGLDGNGDSYHESSRYHSRGYFKMPDGERIEVQDVNIKLMAICLALGIEKPNSARALLLKMNTKVKSLQDIANIIGISKQAVQRRIATELGVGKRQFKENFLLSLTHREMQVFKLYFREKKSSRKVGKILHISHQRVLALAKRLRKRGISRDENLE